MGDLARSLEAAYSVTLPERYVAFLRDAEYQKNPCIRFTGYIRGEYDLDFTTDLLADVTELGIEAGISDIEDAAWSTDYAAYVPLAALRHPDVAEPKMFLVLDVAAAPHPVLLFDQSGFSLFPLASSFEAFLAALPGAPVDLATRFRPGAEETPPSSRPRYKRPPYNELWKSYLDKATRADFKGALADLQKLDAMIPNEPRVLRALAQIHEELGAWDDALAAIDRALKLDGSLLYTFTKVDLLVARADWAAALAVLDSAPEGTDDDKRAERLARSAVCRQKLGDPTAALADAKQALALDENVSFYSEPWKAVFKALRKEVREKA